MAQHKDTFGRGCAHGLPIRILITEGTTADCTKALEIIEGIDAEYLLAYKGCNTDCIVEYAKGEG